MKKRIYALVMALILSAGCGTQNNAAVQSIALSTDQEISSKSQLSSPEGSISVQEDTSGELDASAGILVTDDLSEYVNNEVLVGYANGNFEIHTFEDEAALSAGLAELSQDTTVILIQPNYSYDNDSLSTDDALSSQQWALYNNGSFEMQEEENRFPVYERPFDTPTAPGQWRRPNDFGQPGGIGKGVRTRAFYPTLSGQSVSAEAGVDINIEDAWDIYDGGNREVIVALIDTGIDYNHEDLSEAIWINTDEIANNGIDDDGNGYIDDIYGWNFYSNNNRVYISSSDDSHGTHGAGTIAASIGNNTGIAGIVNSDNVKIMALKALGGSGGSGSTLSVIQAIRYAEKNGASICNLSLGSTTNDRALYQTMANSSMLFVVAAGNEQSDNDSTPSYPASYDLDNIISVANLNYNGELHYSSNYGASGVDLAAPGSYILSTTPNNGYSYMTGTSMAAPMVTGAAAMVYSYHDDITLSDVKEILLCSVAKLDTLSDSVATGGMLDLGAAMRYDIDDLSGERWDAPVYDGSGSAPEITTDISTQQNRSYLVVQIIDPDDDLYVTAYASGELAAEQFANGRAGKTFSLSNDGKAAFSISSAGTYTFYAMDLAGNETVKVVTVESNGREDNATEHHPGQGQMPATPGNGQMQPGDAGMPDGGMRHGQPQAAPNGKRGR